MSSIRITLFLQCMQWKASLLIGLINNAHRVYMRCCHSIMRNLLRHAAELIVCQQTSCRRGTVVVTSAFRMSSANSVGSAICRPSEEMHYSRYMCIIYIAIDQFAVRI
jgi:hypothetical protein